MPLSPIPPLTLDLVRRALALPGFDHEAAWQRMAPRPRVMRRSPDLPGQARPAAVLLLLYPAGDNLAFILTRRTETVAAHRGQISLPGGAHDAGDASLEATALRETEEELAIHPDQVELLGSLAPLYVIVSDFEIYPFVGCTEQRPLFNPSPGEVAALLEVPLRSLVDDRCKDREDWDFGGFSLDVPFYRLGSSVVWGATAIILSEFEMRLRIAAGME